MDSAQPSDQSYWEDDRNDSSDQMSHLEIALLIGAVLYYVIYEFFASIFQRKR